MAILLRLMAVLALLCGLVMSASPVAAGEDLSAPVELPASDDAPTEAGSTEALAPSPDIATVPSEEEAVGDGPWADAVPAPTLTPTAQPPASEVPATDASAEPEGPALPAPPPAADVGGLAGPAAGAATTVGDPIPTPAGTTTVGTPVENPAPTVVSAPPPAPPPPAETAAEAPGSAEVPTQPAPDELAEKPEGTSPPARTSSPAAVDRDAVTTSRVSALPSSPAWTFGTHRGNRGTFASAESPSAARVTIRVGDAPDLPAPSGALATATIVELGVLRPSTPAAIDEGFRAPAVLTGGAIVAAPRVTAAVSVAMDFARLSGGWAGPLVFNLWLRRQLRERRMSQRHLGMLSGVNHSTISRLIAGSRTPSLETAAKLVHALRLEWTEEQVATYFDLLPEHTLFPTQRVESALRGDGDLDDGAVRELMAHYLSLRQRRRATERARADGAANAPARASASGRPDGVT